MPQPNILAVALTLSLASAAVAQSAPQDSAAPPASPASESTASPAVLLEKGIYQQETVGDLAAAASTYRQIIADSTANRKYVAQAMFRLAIICVTQKQNHQAIDLLTRLQSEYADQEDLRQRVAGWLGRARYLMDEKEVDQLVDSAVNQISTMTEADPRRAATLATLDGLNQETVAKALMAKLSSPTSEVRRAAIDVLYKGPFKDISPKVIPTLERLLTNEEAFGRGMAALALGGHKIDADYDKIVKLTVEDPSPYVRRCAVVGLAEMEKPGAKPIVEKIAREDKDQTVQLIAGQMLESHWKENLAGKAWHLWFTRQYPEAEAMFKRALENDPTAANTWNGLGWAQFNQSKKDDARASFEKAVALDPKQAASLNGLGWIAKGEGKADEATAYWKRAVEAAPSATAALSGLAGTALEKGDYDQAATWYQKWLDAEPQNADAKAGVANVLAARDAVPAAQAWLTLIDNGKYAQSWDSAADLFRKAVTSAKWEQAVSRVRGSVGKLISRKLKSVHYLTTLPGAPKGEYVIIHYDSQFGNINSAGETVTPMKDKDGVWRVSGYFVIGQ